MGRRVLILVYEYPPSGGGGVQRVAKFSRYLPDFGWAPVVVAGEVIPGRATDESLAREVGHVRVVRTPARSISTAVARAIRPFRRLRGPRSATAGRGAEARAPAATHVRPPLSGRVARWLGVPDDAAYWIGPAVEAAIELGRREEAGVVLASGPPFSVTIAGARVAKSLGVPLVVDMRDHWRDNPAARWPTDWHRRRSEALERRVMGAADVVLAVSDPIADEARSMGAKDVRVLPNGFDPTDLPARRPESTGPLRVAFMGKVYFGHSDPSAFLEAVARTRASSSDVVFDFVGSCPPEVKAHAAALELDAAVCFHDYLPHREALEVVSRADLGLVLIDDRPGAKASLTGKLFEYLGMGLPILICGPEDGAAANLVRETGAGTVAKAGDVADISRVLTECAGAKRRGEPLADVDPRTVAAYDRRRLTRRLAAILAEVVEGPESVSGVPNG